MVVFVMLLGCTKTEKNLPADHVNPFIGTGGHGHTFPGATVPFGMVQLSPDTRLEGWDGCSGYHYSDTIVYGFSHTHLSGTGVGDYCDILFMPNTGKVQWQNGYKNGVDAGYASRFDKSTEHAEPGYYRVFLKDYAVDAELAATTRAGFHRYTFQKPDNAFVMIDLTHRDYVLESNIEKISDTEIAGYRHSRGWAHDQYVYFYAQFNKPITAFDIAINDTLQPGLTKADNTSLKAAAHFDLKANEPLLVKVGISAVSIDGAKQNLQKEISGWDFDAVKKDAADQWNQALGKIDVSGTDQQKEIFYTALYHTMIAPNVFMDVDGQYRGTDLKVHQSDDFTNYTVFSLWDTYRSLHPLMTIIDRKRTVQFIKTFLHQYENGGQLPVWELAGNYTGCMIGYHSVPVIVDAYMKGITGFDTQEAMKAMQHSAMANHLGLDVYRKYGYIPANDEQESVSKTLEYAYDDWCIAQMAKKMGNDSVYDQYIGRAQSYKNIFDPQTGFMRPKIYGLWKEPFDPKEVDFNFTEANSWQYSFYVPQDVSGLMTMMGGEAAFTNKLDQLFSENSQTSGRDQVDISGLIGQYAHGNEPSHHMAYLYDFAGQPWKTQQRVRQILSEMYSANPDGLSGNEDCGQMSAWYVLSAMGFYPVTPGSLDYCIGSPVLNKVEIHLENGKTFTIKSNTSDKNIYIKSVQLNGKPWNKCYLPHDSIMAGGEMVFEMAEQPNKEWGSASGDQPVSAINSDKIMPVPYTTLKSRSFKDETSVDLESLEPDAAIYYTTDTLLPKSDWKKYTEPFSVDKSITIRYFAKDQTLGESKTTEINLIKFKNDRTIKLLTAYSPQYAADGDNTLIDGVHGGRNFRLGDWQGYQGVNVEAVVDFGRQHPINTLSIGFLQDIGSWIFFPSKVEFFVSDNGKTFIPVGTVKQAVATDYSDPAIKNFSINVYPKTVRYVKVVATNIGTCPEWHSGAGHPAWLFTDEITIK